MNDIVKIDYTDNKVIKTLKETVALGATDQEFAMFSEICKATGLNPFKREVWFIKAGGRVQIMTGNQGFHTIANSHPQYDGIETGFVGKDGEYLPIAYPKPDFIGAWARVYRKDRRIPIEAVAMLSEYDKGQSNWKTMRRIMIVKCAESLALRKSFPQELNGLYTAEEMPVEFSATSATQIESRKIVSKIEPENKIMRTMNAIEGGLAFGYEIPKMTGKKRDEFKDIFRTFGCVAKGGITYCYREIPEWSDFLVVNSIKVITPEELEAVEPPIEWTEEDEELAFGSAKEKEGANI